MDSFKSCFIFAFLSAVFVGLAYGHVADSATHLNYWKTMLPNSPMPQALLDALPSSEKANGAVNANKASFLKQEYDNSVFLQEKDLIPGTKLNIHFKKNMHGPRFASPQMAKKMPSLTSKNLPQILQFFSVNPNSETAKVIGETIEKCEKREAFTSGLQFCATSLEEFVTHVTSEFGDSKHIKAVSMPSFHTETPVDYKIMSVKMIAPMQSLIPCHTLSYPVGLYYCHRPSDSAAYAITLVGVRNGIKTDAYAMCHQHHSEWIPKHAFKTLGAKPGTRMCHLTHLDDVIWYKA